MGANQSAQLKQTTEVLNKSVTNIVNTNTTKANATQSNTNRYSIELGEGSELNCKEINLNQKIQSDQKLKVQAKISNVSDLKTMLKSAVDNATQQNNASANGFLTTAFNNQKSNTEINNILKNEIENNITTENLTECNAVIDNLNEGKLTLKKNAKINCDVFRSPQEIATNQLVECYADAIQQALMQNENIASAVNKSTQSNKSENKGAAELVNAVMGPYAMIIIAVIVALVIFIPLIIFAFKSGGSSESVSPVETAAAQYLRRIRKGRY